MYEHGAFMGFGGGLMWLFWIALIVAVVWGAKSLIGGEHRRSPLEILEERYARGEIDHDEFERRRDDLAGRGVG